MFWGLIVLNYRNYQEFWDHYVYDHRDSRYLWLHFLGISSALVLMVMGLWQQSYELLWWAPVASFGSGWFGGLVFNKKVKFPITYLWWCLLSDYRLANFMIKGKMKGEIDRVLEPFEGKEGSRILH